MVLYKDIFPDGLEITIRRFHKKYNYNPIQRAIIRTALGKEKIFNDPGKVVYVENQFSISVNRYARTERLIDLEEVINVSKNYPKFLIDLSFYNYHTKRGKSSLLTQVIQSLSVIRDFLFDTNLYLVNPPRDLILGRNYVNQADREILASYKSVILDPSAEKVLTFQDLKKYEFFALGGIVDVGLEWKGATTSLFSDISADFKRIELNGSIYGVPDRINLLIKILLEALYKWKNLDIAILLNQRSKDIQIRFWRDLKRILRRDKEKNVLYVSKEDLSKVLDNINADLMFIEGLLKKQNIEMR